MQWITYYCPAARLIDFAIGCWLGYIFIHVKKVEKKRYVYYVAEIIVALLIICSWYLYAKGITILGSEYAKYTTLFTPTSVALIWLIVREGGFISKILSYKILVCIGDLSPYTFLIHDVAIKYCRIIGGKFFRANIYEIAIASLVITFVAAIIWRILEKKMIFHNIRHSIKNTVNPP